MAKILITGGSGFVGRAISEAALKQGHQPIWLGREAGEWKGIKKYKWDIDTSYLDERALEGVDHIIHLAGAGIADKRWTERYKQEIIDSRIKSSALLFDYLSKGKHGVKSLAGASAIGYYGARQSKHLFNEEDFPGTDFLAKTCLLWEKSYFPFGSAGIRTVTVRTGLVLGKEGGFYKKMLPFFKLGAGFSLGNGQQYFPWIHVDDLVSIYLYALQNEATCGAYNAVGSELVTNKEVSKRLAQSLHSPFFLPGAPSFLLNMGLGESAVMLTEGLKISNGKIKQAGFKFQFETVKDAFDNLKAG